MARGDGRKVMASAFRIAACLAFALAAAPALAQSNPFARFPSLPELLNGRWNGVDLERRSNCTNAQNEGTRGTYAQFDVSVDNSGNFIVAQSGITGLNCAYNGRHATANGVLGVQGTLTCSDGKQGSFQTRAVTAAANRLDLHMSIQLTAGETCSVDALVSMARLTP